MTLRQAARRSSRSVTTLRRYIRAGRLSADKRAGRFGPEYFVTEEALSAAGLPTAEPASPALPVRTAPRSELALATHESVPATLFRDLQMKHEQLLVQYGMMRVGGLRAVELRADLEDTRRRLEEAQARTAELRRRMADDTARLRQRLRRAELEQESRQIEVEALREKIRSLEMLTRNADTNQSIEQQFSEIMEQSRRVREIDPGDPTPAAQPRKSPLDH